jgi:hypothetical protein
MGPADDLDGGGGDLDRFHLARALPDGGVAPRCASGDVQPGFGERHPKELAGRTSEW